MVDFSLFSKLLNISCVLDVDVQDEVNVFLLAVTSVQRNRHGLLGEALPGLAEEMHLDLIVEN